MHFFFLQDAGAEKLSSGLKKGSFSDELGERIKRFMDFQHFTWPLDPLAP